MPSDYTLRNTVCGKGHTHPPWSTTGVLRIDKCETVCGFCQKHTNTAANLRKHVAIHIKNERLNLIIAEGSSGRGRLEMPLSRHSPGKDAVPSICDDETADHDPGPSLLTSLSNPSTTTSPIHYRFPIPLPPTTQCSSFLQKPHSSVIPPATPPSTLPSSAPPTSTRSFPAANRPTEQFLNIYHPPGTTTPPDLFTPLRKFNIGTKEAWTAIPSAEGFKVVELCKSLSVSDGSHRPPCYNREIIFDEEWQAHMKDVHGVFLLWPETWMRRVEVLDLDAFGGDIGVCNDVIMG
ncbi:hypothetical protein B0O99DRAFT_504104 [Bisporella sp. PMI_857]|nr:hypothetical protein B0O99DRAFT_504104 [Bisporella sp. PMI_857]